MNEAPNLSIIMCVWKPRSDWFRAAVLSALAQQHCRLELVVVDDGSPEPAASLLSDIEDSRLRIVRAEHGGLARARNVGIEVAEGAYFRFVDGDDVLEANSSARLLRLTEEGKRISYGATLICDAEMRPIGVKSSSLEGWIAEACLLYRFDVRHMSMIFPRRVVEATGDWDVSLRQCQDWDFVLRALEHAPVRGEQHIATHYRRHSSSASTNLEGAHHYESLVVDRYFERHPNQSTSGFEREARAKLLMVRASTCRARGKPRAAQLRLVARAIRTHPRRACEELLRTTVKFLRGAPRLS